MKEQEIFDHIEAGRHQELYPEWAKTDTWSVINCILKNIIP